MTAAIWSMALVWFVCAFLCSYIAGQKRREPTIWFFAGLSLGFLAVLALIAVPALTEEEAKNRKEQKEREHKEIMSAREAKGDALLIDGKIYVLKTSEEEGSSDPSQESPVFTTRTMQIYTHILDKELEEALKSFRAAKVGA